jgi:AcrR family transcriptional regulator
MAISSVRGLNGISIGQLATRMSMSKSGLFAHFGSKEALQLAVIEEIVGRFIRDVIRPAIAETTGLERIHAVFDSWLGWSMANDFPGGCPLVAATIELDDQEGNMRDKIAEMQSMWLECLARMAKKAVKDGDFREDLVVNQFAFELNGIGLAFNHAHRLFRDHKAESRARTFYSRLLQDAQKS